MSDKYIIANCPCYNAEYEECLNTFRDEYEKCYNCTDCKMKQIVEFCKENLNSLETYVDVRSPECVTLQNILKLLDIQEVDDDA